MFKICNVGICHPESVSFVSRTVYCNECRRTLYDDINKYLSELPPHLSVYVAQKFAESTGQIYDVRCKLPLLHLPGILPSDAVFVTYDTLVQVVRLLGIMNGSFVVYNNALADRTNLDTRIIEGFLVKFKNMIAKQHDHFLSEQKQLLDLLNVMIEYMEKTVSGGDYTNFVDQFSNVYVPYVKHFENQLITTTTSDSNLLIDLYTQVNGDANEIRRVYGKHSLQFELTYVMVYVYLFTESLDVAMNVILRFVSQACKPDHFVRHNEEFEPAFFSRLAKTHNRQLMRRVETLRREGCREYISVELLRDVDQLQDIFNQGFTLETDSNMVVQYAKTQGFPSVLFSTESHYYGFLFIMTILKQNYDSKNNVLRKNTVSKCKTVLDFVQEFIERFNAFSKDDTKYWTIDVFKMFLCSDATFQKRYEEMFRMFLSSAVNDESIDSL